MACDLTLLVCESLRRETDASLAGQGFEGVRVSTVRAVCAPTPAQREELCRAVASRVEEHGACCLLGGGCLLGATLPASLERSLLVVRAATCFELLASRGLVEQWIRDGAHLLTPGWLARWRHTLDGWGLDRKTAAELFREGSKRLLLLDTGVDDAAPTHLREMAEYLGLPWEIAPVGLDHYRLQLQEVVRRARAALPGCSDLAVLRRRVADNAAIFDFVTRLAGGHDESQVVDRLLELAQALLAPERILYCPVDGEAVGPVRVQPSGARPCADLEREMRALRGDAGLTASGRGVLFRVADERETLGLVALDGLAFPRYRERYLDLVRTLAQAAGVAAGSARALSRAARAEAEERRAREEMEKGLQKALEDVRTLRGLLPICAACRRVRDTEGHWTQFEEYVARRSGPVFTHGMCPDCYRRIYPGYDP